MDDLPRGGPSPSRSAPRSRGLRESRRGSPPGRGNASVRAKAKWRQPAAHRAPRRCCGHLDLAGSPPTPRRVPAPLQTVAGGSSPRPQLRSPGPSPGRAERHAGAGTAGRGGEGWAPEGGSVGPGRGAQPTTSRRQQHPWARPVCTGAQRGGQPGPRCHQLQGAENDTVHPWKVAQMPANLGRLCRDLGARIPPGGTGRRVQQHRGRRTGGSRAGVAAPPRARPCTHPLSGHCGWAGAAAPPRQTNPSLEQV